MKTDTDWDAVDYDGDDGVIDFEELEEPPTPKKEVKPKVEPKPTQTQKVHIEPPPVAVTPKQEKMISDAAKAAKKLSKELETLDFQVEKFVKFEQRFSSFKIKNTIAIGSIALLLGGYIGSSAQSELNTYYVNQEVKHKLSEAAADIELLKKVREQGVNFVQEDGRIVIYTTAQNKAAAVWKDSNHQGLQLTLDTKKGDTKK